MKSVNFVLQYFITINTDNNFSFFTFCETDLKICDVIISMKMETKICKTCKTEKPMNEFSTRQAKCKQCRRTQRREQYKESNKSIKEENKQSKSITCECGRTITRVCLKKHQKSKKHFENIQRKIEENAVYDYDDMDYPKHIITQVNPIHNLEPEKISKKERKDGKQLVTYYDETNNLKKIFLYVEPATFSTFRKMREKERKLTNYKILKDLNLI